MFIGSKYPKKYCFFNIKNRRIADRYALIAADVEPRLCSTYGPVYLAQIVAYELPRSDSLLLQHVESRTALPANAMMMISELN